MFPVALLLLLAAGCVKCEQLTQPASATVQPGQRLTITCQVSYSVSSFRTQWIRQPAGRGLEWIGGARVGYTPAYKDSLKNKFSISLDSSSNTVTLNGQNLQLEDTAVYYCARQTGGSGFDYWGKGTMVTVTSASPKAPTVFPLIQCGSGAAEMITLGCLATDFSPSSVTYSWTKNGVALDNFIQYPPVLKNDAYMGISQITVSKQDWDPKNEFQCAVSNSAGNTEAPFRPGVVQHKHIMPETLRVLASYDAEKEASLSCFAKDFSPKSATMKWLKNGEDYNNKIDETVTTSEKSNENGTLYSAVSQIRVKAQDWAPDITFTCLFEIKGASPASMNSSVTYQRSVNTPCTSADVEVTIIEPSLEDMFLKRRGQLVCQVKANRPTIDRVWWEDEKKNEMRTPDMVKVNDALFTRALDITYEEWNQGIKRICMVEHSEYLDPVQKSYQRNIVHPDLLIEINTQWNKEGVEDDMGGTAITFIFLFFITLLFSIGTTAFKIK